MSGTFLLGRFSRALREQNWAAAGIELGIVVLGVVIGFQITAWGQARSDRQSERVYLRQLAADLRETERRLDVADSVHAPRIRAADRLAGAFYATTPTPRESLLVWIGTSGW